MSRVDFPCVERLAVAIAGWFGRCGEAAEMRRAWAMKLGLERFWDGDRLLRLAEGGWTCLLALESDGMGRSLSSRRWMVWDFDTLSEVAVGSKFCCT